MTSDAMPAETTLVIPGRNAACTLDACLTAATAMLGQDGLVEILFVDDGSTDATRQIAERYPVRVVRGEGRGAAAARNLGWRLAATPLIWFIDSDCVPQPDALARLLPRLSDPGLAGVGGSYDNACGDSLLASLIHEEIIERHLQMPAEVNFLASFNVLYRRNVLEEVGGFDPDCFWAHDAELAYRIGKRGWRLGFERDSRVAHYHPQRISSYLGKQRLQGFYRMLLYQRHPERMRGDSYAGWLDYVQPPLAALAAAATPLAIWPWGRWLLAALLTALAAAQAPMAWRIARRLRRPAMLAFAPLGFVRAFFRAAGMVQGTTRVAWDRVRRQNPKSQSLGLPIS